MAVDSLGEAREQVVIPTILCDCYTAPTAATSTTTTTQNATYCSACPTPATATAATTTATTTVLFPVSCVAKHLLN